MIDNASKVNAVFHTHSAPGYGLHPEVEERYGDQMRNIGYKNRGLNSRAGNIGKLTGEALWKNNWCQLIIHNVLLPYGGVQLCCQDYGLEEPIGNLLHMPYHTLFETKRFKEIMQGKASICQRCDDGVAVPNSEKMRLRRMEFAEDSWRIEKMKEKLGDMRRAGLERSGEYSAENLAFKLLRRTGYLKKMYDAYDSDYDSYMSLNES